MKNTFILVAAAILFCMAKCDQQKNGTAKFYSHNLIDFLNDNLNEAVIQDGFSPPVAGRIYAYANLAAYEAYNYDNPGKLQLKGVLNGFAPNYNFPKDKKVDNDFAMFSAFYKMSYFLVYRDFIIDSFIVSKKDFFKSRLDKDVYANSEALGDSIVKELVNYAKRDKYPDTRSCPLYQLPGTPGTWEPTPPMYATAVEPCWGQIRPFMIDRLDTFLVPTPVPFDTAKKSSFYKLVEQVYEIDKKSDENEQNIAHYWDGDPNPPKRIKRVNVFMRQLNPVGHWLSIAKTLNHQTHKNEAESLETYLRVSLACTDALIVCWENKYNYNTVRPITYINRYMDKNWNPLLATPAFPEYPSGHSMIAGSAAGVLIDIFGDSIPFVDSTQVKFDFPARSYRSISDAANECAQSRVYGGVHFEQAVREGVILGKKVAALENGKLSPNKTVSDSPHLNAATP